MWPFVKKKSIKESNLLAGGCDFHSHLLPGVDDGIATLQESVEALTAYEGSGISDIWLTPHIMEDFPNKIDKLREHHAVLCSAYKGKITLHLAAEYMLDGAFDDLLDKNEFLPIGKGGNHLLVETSYFTPPINLDSTLQRIKSKGYHPLLAHPERYIYMDKARYNELRDKGIKFQLNIMSLVGAYGYEAQKKAEWMLKNDMYTVAGSDLHSAEALELISQVKLNAMLMEKLKNTITTKI